MAVIWNLCGISTLVIQIYFHFYPISKSERPVKNAFFTTTLYYKTVNKSTAINPAHILHRKRKLHRKGALWGFPRLCIKLCKIISAYLQNKYYIWLYSRFCHHTYTGKAKRTSYLYHPYAALDLCLAFRFFSCFGLVAILISSGTACAAFALAFATALFKAIRLLELAYSSGKSDEMYILSEVSSIS